MVYGLLFLEGDFMPASLLRELYGVLGFGV